MKKKNREAPPLLCARPQSGHQRQGSLQRCLRRFQRRSGRLARSGPFRHCGGLDLIEIAAALSVICEIFGRFEKYSYICAETEPVGIP